LDSVGTPASPADSAASGTGPDPARSTGGKRSGIEGPITYKARSIENLVHEKKTFLDGRAEVHYQDITLKAERITVDWDAREMRAEGVWNTVLVATEAGDTLPSPRLLGAPEFKEGVDVMTGEVMVFNFETRKGRVLRGRSAFEEGFYGGEALKLVRPREFNVGEASFTTCDHEQDPHFRIHSRQMKIKVNDKVIARPVVLFIGRIPVMALPFAVFPIRRGRHSGFLIPRYGESVTEGRHLRGIGYYWAPSEYWDFQNQVDYFEKSGFLVRSRANYQVRYKLRGSVSGSWTRKNFEAFDRKERRWDLNVSHSQELTPATRLTVDASFISSGRFYQELSTSREHRLTQEIRSNAKLSQRWGSSGNIQLYLNQTRNLTTDDISVTLPEISVSNRITSLIPAPKSRRRSDTRWYHAIQAPYQFNSRFLNSKRESTSGGVKTVRRQEGVGFDHSMNVYISPKLFGWLTVRPSLDIKQTLYDRRKIYFIDPETNRAEEREEHGFYHLTTYNTALNLNTKIYGVFRSRHMENVIVRHVMTPNVSFQYQPDFSRSGYGYYQTVIDTADQTIRMDRYSGALFRGTPASEMQSMNMSLQNLFQMKVGEGENARKFDLFTYNLSTAYNWKAPQFKLSDLNSRLQANPARSLGVSMNATHTFYRTDSAGKKIDRMFVSDADWSDPQGFRRLRLGRMTQLSLNLNFRFSGKLKTQEGERASQSGMSGDAEDPEDPSDFLNGGLENVRNISGDRFEADDKPGSMEIPWNLSGNLSYTENRINPLQVKKTVWAQANLDFNLTKHWKISYRSRWDLEERKAVSQDFVFYRDLHCWEAQFSWTPTGPYRRFYFRINVKSPMLQELKFERGTGRSGLYGY